MLSHYKNEVVIAYDNDGAGARAAARAIGIFEKLDVKARVLRMTGEQKDPDEFIKARGADAFRKLIEQSENRMEFRLRSIREQYDMNDPDQKLAFAAEAARLVARLPSQAERQVYSAEVARQVGVTEDAMKNDVETERKKQLRSVGSRENRDMISHAGKRRKYDNPASAVAEEGIVRLLMMDPTLITSQNLPAPSDFTDKRLAKFYEHITAMLRRGETVTITTLGPVLENDEMSLLVEITAEPENLSDSSKVFADYIAAMKKARPRSIEEILKEKQELEKGNQ